MAVVAVWQCDRDGSMFQNKKDAEEYDKMLELAENLSTMLEEFVPEMTPEASESAGLFLARHREVLSKACKGKPELLLHIDNSESEKEEENEDKVTPITANV